jgi:serine O-acetyltransferase
MGIIREEIRVIKERDPAIKSTAEVFLYPSLYAILFHKLAHWLYKKDIYFLARLISQISRGLTGIEIHPGAVIGTGLFIDHGMGVVIGETAEIGDNVTIYQGVTLGGTGKDTGKRHPTIGDNVMIGTGAKVLGPFKVGDNAKIAAGAVVLNAIPPNCTVVGVPGRIVERAKQEATCDNLNEMLNQIKVPDPIATQFCKMCNKIDKLETELKQLKKQNDNKVGGRNNEDI